MVVGVFGGAFDTIHVDHLRMARAAILQGACEQVWLAPSPDRWDKSPRASVSHRISMLRLALEGESLPIHLCEAEAASTYRGTYHFLCSLREQFPQHEFRWLAGADSIANILQWRDPETYDGTNPNGAQLLREFSLILFLRAGSELHDDGWFSHGGYRMPSVVRPTGNLQVGDAASRVLRASINEEPAMRAQLPPGVWEYIQQHKLYQVTDQMQ